MPFDGSSISQELLVLHGWRRDNGAASRSQRQSGG